MLGVFADCNVLVRVYTCAHCHNFDSSLIECSNLEMVGLLFDIS